MYMISYAGFFYGPFATANHAAEYATEMLKVNGICGPWSIVAIREPTALLKGALATSLQALSDEAAA